MKWTISEVDRLLTCFLPVRVENVDVHRSVQAVSDSLHISLLELVVAADGLGGPVAPVQVVLADRNRQQGQTEDTHTQLGMHSSCSKHR